LELSQACEHRGDSPQQSHDGTYVSSGSEVKYLDGLEGGGSLCGFASGASKSRQAISTSAAGSLSDAKIGREQSPAKLIAELGVATW
jgi:hypothetical protein